MKSTNSQPLMIALAIVFTVALALTVAMICLSSLQTEPQGKGEPTRPHLTTSPSPTLSAPETVVSGVLLPPAESETEMLGNGLVFERIELGVCRLIDVGTCEDAFVVIPEYAPNGDRVIAIGEKALLGCESVTAVQIPSTVKQIGALAFADCPNLIYISVSEKNPAYRDVDGVLYTADGSTLILYPPMRGGSSVFLPTTVTRISDMAFYRCSYLSSIRYGGSAEQWEQIVIGIKNYSLIAASVVFSAKS